MNNRIPSEDLFENSRMSFGEHLEELRKVLIKCLISIAIGCVFGFMFANPIVKMLTKPLVRAMEDYIKTESIEDLVNRKGYVDPDLSPWLENEKFVPRQAYVDPLELVSAIQAILPNFADQIKIEPYGFRPENFEPTKINQLCHQLATSGTLTPTVPMASTEVINDSTNSSGNNGENEGNDTSDATEASDRSVQRSITSQQTSPKESVAAKSRRQRIWNLLTDQEQKQIRRIAGLESPDAAVKPNVENDFESAQLELTAIFNRVIRETNLFETPEFAPLVADPEKNWFEFFVASPKNPLAEMRQQYQENSDPSVARRLNRALIADLFAPLMGELRADLVPLDVWERADFQPQALGVTETFMVWLKAGIITGITLAGPFVFYHLWSFVAAGLYPHEQKYVYIYLPISIALFISGVLLVFLFVFEPVLQFLFSFNRQMGIAPQMRINDWLSFVMFLPIGFGIAFQLPLVMLFMNRIGLFQVSDYLQKWRVAVMSIFVLSMFLTPQDPISLLLLAIPLCFLYFLGVGMCVWMPKHQNPFEEPEREYTTA